MAYWFIFAELVIHQTCPPAHQMLLTYYLLIGRLHTLRPSSDIDDKVETRSIFEQCKKQYCVILPCLIEKLYDLVRRIYRLFIRTYYEVN